jgi:hypothetical protein
VLYDKRERERFGPEDQRRRIRTRTCSGSVWTDESPDEAIGRNRAVTSRVTQGPDTEDSDKNMQRLCVDRRIRVWSRGGTIVTRGRPGLSVEQQVEGRTGAGTMCILQIWP